MRSFSVYLEYLDMIILLSHIIAFIFNQICNIRIKKSYKSNRNITVINVRKIIYHQLATTNYVPVKYIVFRNNKSMFNFNEYLSSINSYQVILITSPYINDFTKDRKLSPITWIL